MGKRVLLLAALLAGCRGVAERSGGLETIAPDYSNIRGLNYIPSYAGSSVGVWSRYDRPLVERELRNTRRLGANSIRVWLNYWSWKHRPEAFIGNFRHLLATSASGGLYVMPILWDSCFGVNPNSKDTPWLDFDRWVPNPGGSWITKKDAWSDFDRYVEAVVAAGKNSPALLMWDIMNEPSGKGIDPWLVHYVDLVRRLDPHTPITIGWAITPKNYRSAGMVDVVSYHPYGVFRENIRHFSKQARDFAARHGDLPILATELGAPGAAARYEDVLRFLEEEGVGFMLFEAVIHTHPAYPYSLSNGFLFTDGEVRDAEGARAFREFARRRGGWVGEPFEEKSAEDPDYLPYHPVPGGFGGPELLELVTNWGRLYGKERYARLNGSNAAFYGEAIGWAFISLAWLEVLEPSEVARAMRNREAYNQAVREKRFPDGEAVLRSQVELAARIIRRAGIGPQN